ncbi:hypothetical protein ASPTUDRAFT_54974 [Aspergillus tubingensis CBS 134.48]|uniref:DUF7709 domain-containing protein n=1 Tax=Aspergillus tubingensis (strain CBS 134.48) TaxID=767770 RepID=A0A1L9N847_ASPTC|nr:hypothetical protein ASPTUDRAFT_54974 [Aspergillus tubingensis CBS 134.48]
MDTLRTALRAAIPLLMKVGMFDLFPPEEWIQGDNEGRKQYGNKLITSFNADYSLSKCQTLICATANINHMRFDAMGPCNPPMTKKVTGGSSRSAKGPRARNSQSIASSSTTGAGGGSALPRQNTTLEPASASPGYLGSTSYSAILAEHRPEFSLHVDNSSIPTTLSHPMEPERLQTGVRLLKLLQNLTICDSLIRRYYTRVLVAVIPEVVTMSIVRSARSVLGALDFTEDVEDQLQNTVRKVSQNTSRPLSTYGSMTVEQYCAAFTEQNLRWEAIGIIFATAGMSLSSTPESDPDLYQVAADTSARERLRAQLVEASSTCLSFSDQASSVNELLGFCQYSSFVLLTHVYGDSSYQAWRRLRELSATIYAAGLHQESPMGNNCPLFLRQWRRSCFAAAFSADKNQATFVGRPPSINYRYSTLTPPLDISERTIVHGGDELNAAISRLDSFGWSAKDEVDRASVLRLRFILAVFRERALEIALGTGEHSDAVQNSDEIIKQARESWAVCPVRLRYDVLAEGTESGPLTKSFTLLHIYLDYLYTIFLLQRTVAKRANTGHEALFDTSRTMLSNIIKGNADSDPAFDLSRHRAWIFLYYGLPSASVLILELLHQNQGIGTYTTALPRAEIIRNLSVFISCLSWVARPGHGNYHTCKEAERKLSHILDQVLDPQPIEDLAFHDATSGLYSLLDWYHPSNPNNWDFNSEYLPPQN